MSFVRMMFDAFARREGDIVLQDGEESLTGAQILDQSARVAGALARHGVGAGGRLVICLANNIETLLCVFASWRLGASPLIMDFRAPAAERASVCRTIGSELLVESRRPPGSEDVPAALFDSAWRYGLKPPADRLDQCVDESAVALLSQSSGTTGTPKIYVQYQDIMAGRTNIHMEPPPNPGACYASPMSLSFSATRNRVLGWIIGGGVVRFLPFLYSPDELIEALLSCRARGSALPPPVIRRLIQDVGPRSTPLFRDMTTLLSMGGPVMPEDKIAAYHNLSNAYGINYASSLTGLVSSLRGSDVLARPETSGRVLEGIRVAILDPATYAPLPLGETGLIKVSSDSVAREVIGDTNERFGPGWGIPGDLGMLDEEGFLTIVGRGDDVIVRGGVNVGPDEIEATLRRHPAVADVAVIGMDDPAMGQEIVAVIVAQDVSEAELHAYAMKNIAPQKRPRRIELVKSLPYSHNGKLLRREVARLLAES